MHLDPEKEVWLVYLFAFSNLSNVLKDNEMSGKHVQDLKVFLFFNLFCCPIHFLVTFPPFLNALFLRYGPPRPPSCPSFLVMWSRPFDRVDRLQRCLRSNKVHLFR